MNPPPLRAIVLAAGFGTRLGALSDERPKPLLPVVDVPLLRYNLALLAAHGVTEVAINLHHRGELIVAELGERCGPIALTWSREATLLGTGGGLKQIAEWLTRGGRDPFLVVNGKLVIDLDLGRVVTRHLETEAAATMVLREVADAERWGAIDLDAEGRVVRILGEGPAGVVARRTMFTGVHVVSPALTDLLPDGESCVIRQGYLPLLRRGARIEGVLHDRYFQEHSTPARYLAGNFAVLDGSAALRWPPGLLDGVDASAVIAGSARLVAPFRIGPRARIGDGAVIGPYAVVGHRATVEARAHLVRTVVWPDAAVAGALDGAIVTPRGAVPVDLAAG